MAIFTEYLITLGWALTGAVAMALGLGLAIFIFTRLTPLDEWAEIKKGNMAAAVVLAAAIIAFAIVIAKITTP